MTLFNSSRFLCCSMSSFGVSTTSFNMFSTSAMIFIKCWNQYHMKNNTRYKGNINITSVIIFLKLPAENLQYFPWDNLQWDFCCIFILFLTFILLLMFFISFLIFTLLYRPLLMFFILLLFIHIFFSTSSLTLLWTIAGGFYIPFYTFSPAHQKVIRDTFIFRPFHLAASATVFSGHFLPTGASYLMLLHRHFNLRLSRIHWEPAVLPWSL